jgi:hypothetical protein
MDMWRPKSTKGVLLFGVGENTLLSFLVLPPTGGLAVPALPERLLSP